MSKASAIPEALRVWLWREATSLRSAIVLTVLIGVAIPVGMTAYQHREWSRERFAERLRANLESTSQLLSGTLVTQYWRYDRHEANATMAAAFADPSIASIEIVESDGKLFTSRSRSDASSADTMSLATPLIRDGAKIGTLVVTMHSGAINEQLDAALQKDIVLALETLLGAFVLISLLLRMRLVSPIRRLVAAATALENGDLATPITSGHHDEIGQLARSLESTRKALANSFAELERRVEQRTAALSESNAALQAALGERDAAQEKALQSLAVLQSILDCAPVGICLKDAKDRHTHANRRYCEMSGYTLEQLLGHTSQRFFRSYEDYVEFTKRAMACMREGETYREELQLLNRYGATMWIRLYVSVIDPKDFSQGMVLAGEDISARKRDEERLQETNRALQATLHDLRASQSQLIQSEKMASLGQLVANVAHEINTPISAVKSSGRNVADAIGHIFDNLPAFQALDRELRAHFPALIGYCREPAEFLNSREERRLRREVTQQLENAGIARATDRADMLIQMRAHTALPDYLPLLRHPDCDVVLNLAFGMATIVNSTQNINTAVERVAKIVFALKSFSHTGGDGEMTEANLRDGVETVLTLYQNQIKRGIELVLDYEEIPPLSCLPDELNQVWTNLIHNALQAMNYAGTLSVGIRRAGNDAVVSIADTGCGIPDEIRGKIFDPFFTTKPTGEGSGLGLDIVRKIVDKHGGRIEVASKVGVGTTFRIYLPFELEKM